MAARIRTIKPEAFKDAKLWDACQKTGLPLFQAYAALWCQADREGRFRWKPRELKTDCLPYWDGDFETVLYALADHGFIVRYEHAGRSYGWIPRFKDHQHINGHEARSILPEPVTLVEIPRPSGHEDVVTLARESREPLTPSIPFHSIPSESDARAGAESPQATSAPEPRVEVFPELGADRETVCPQDLAERAERANIPEQFAKTYGVPIEAVRYHVEETRVYWTIGGGCGRRKKNWMQVLRTRLNELGKARALIVPAGAAQADPAETKRRREADEAAAFDRQRRRVRSESGSAPSTPEAAKAALSALMAGGTR